MRDNENPYIREMNAAIKDKPMIVPWKRFWRRFGDAIHLDDDGRGFLTDPEGEPLTQLYNPHLRTFDQLLEHPCLILCGDPGAGKSTVIQVSKAVVESVGEQRNVISIDFRDVPSEAVFSRRTFESATWKQWQTSNSKLLLLVDAIDEGLVKIPGFVSYLASELRGAQIDRLQTILVCRSAEWPLNEGAQLTRLWGFSEKQPIFELCPLRHRDAVQAAEVLGVNATEFIQAVYQQNVAGLAALPMTLFFLLDEFRSEGRFASTHRELYERACKRLAAEHDPRRAETMRARRKTDLVSTSEEIYGAACRLAALLLLCGKSAIHVGAIDEIDGNGDLHLSEGVDPSAGPHALSEEKLFDATSSALFTARGPQRFGFAHQTVAESLAAQFLADFPLAQLRKLLCARDSAGEHVIPQLAETAAWLAGLREDFFVFLCQTEPEVLLRSDVSKAQNHRKQDLVVAILEKARRADLFDEKNLGRFFASLDHPHLAAQLRPYITDKGYNVEGRRIAMSIARECEVAELSDDLFNMIDDVSESQQFREQAARTLEHVLPTARLAELIPIATGHAGFDPDDTLRGCALRRLVPEIWSVSQAAPYLHAAQNDHFFGAYDSVLKYHLPKHMTDDDLPTVLDMLIQKTHCFDTLNALQELAEVSFVRALHNLSKPDVCLLAVQLWMTKLKNHQPLPLTEQSPIAKSFKECNELRRKFLSAILNDQRIPVDDLIYLYHGYPALVLQADLEWALVQIGNSPKERQGAWASFVWQITQPESACKCWDLLLQKMSEIPELSAKFSWLRAWQIDEPVARKQKANWLGQIPLRRRIERRHPSIDNEDLINECLADIAAGKTSRWIELCHRLADENERTHFLSLSNHDLVQFPGWKRADECRRTLIRDAARNYLLNQTDGFAKLGGPPNYCAAGYIAIWLLRKEIRGDESLKATIATNWINALITGFARGTEYDQEMAALAYELNPDAVLQAFVREMANDDREHGDIYCLGSFRMCWDTRFTAAALDLVRNCDLKPDSIGAVLRFAPPIEQEEAASSARMFLGADALARSANEERTVAVLTACVAGLASATWDFVWPIIEANSALAEKVMLRVAKRANYSREKSLPSLTERQLAHLYLKVHSLFPPETDPDFSRGGVVTPRQNMVHFRGDIVNTLEARGTEEACSALLWLGNTLPNEHLSMRRRWHNARISIRRKAWFPPSPKTILGLAARSDSRLVRNTDDLMEVVLESLSRLQIALVQSTLPRGEDLWHWDGADTQRKNFRHRDEAYLSNYVARWLAEDLQQRGIVIGREVQLRQGQRTDIHVTAVAEAAGSLLPDATVVIETKGCWNPSVLTALAGQLVGDYLRLNGRTHGIYLVGWFVCEKWDNSLNRLTSKTFSNAQEEIAHLAAKYDGEANPEHVWAVLLDCSYPVSSKR